VWLGKKTTACEFYDYIFRLQKNVANGDFANEPATAKGCTIRREAWFCPRVYGCMHMAVTISNTDYSETAKWEGSAHRTLLM
jgi:hypothetical protein